MSAETSQKRLSAAGVFFGMLLGGAVGALMLYMLYSSKLSLIICLGIYIAVLLIRLMFREGGLGWLSVFSITAGLICPALILLVIFGASSLAKHYPETEGEKKPFLRDADTPTPATSHSPTGSPRTDTGTPSTGKKRFSFVGESAETPSPAQNDPPKKKRFTFVGEEGPESKPENTDEKSMFEALLDPNCDDPIILTLANGEPATFKQVATIPYGEDRMFCILAAISDLEGIPKDEGIVFEMKYTDDGERVFFVQDRELAEEIFKKYERLFDEQGDNQGGC